MNLKSFITSLVPSISKSDILDDLEFLRKQLRDDALPVYKDAAEHFKKFRFKSKFALDANKEFMSRSNTGYSGDMVSQIHQAFENTQRTIDLLEDMAGTYYGKNNPRGGTTYLRANILTHIESIGFALKYAGPLLLRLYAEESRVRDSSIEPWGTKAEREWMSIHWRSFIDVVNLLSREPAAIEKSYRSIPDAVIIPDRIEELEATVGGRTRINPLRHNFISSQWWPIYHIQIARAEWQANLRDKAVAEKSAIQYSLLNLRSLDSGNVNAQVQQEIKYHQDRVSKLTRKIAKLEGR